GREQEGSGRGGTRLTHSACGAAAVAFIRCASCGFPASRIRRYNWGEKAIRRMTTGTGRMRYLRYVAVCFKYNFRQGTQAGPRKKGASASS
ncbi:hypothetical protein ACB092_01G336500, partial [Castanea dentata]